MLLLSSVIVEQPNKLKKQTFSSNQTIKKFRYPSQFSP